MRLGSISAAAVEQNIAVSAVSRRLSDMEHRLGTTVLYRKGRGVEPTPAGITLLKHAQNLLRLADRAADEMSDFAEGGRGHVRVAANPSAIAQFLPSLFSSFATNNENVKIALKETMSDGVVRDVSDGVADLGIFSEIVDHTGIETFTYLEDRLCVIAPLDHPMAKQTKVAFTDILDFPHVALEDGSSLFAQFSTRAAEAGGALDIAVRVRSFDGVRRMVGSGLGLGILPYGVAAPYAKSDGLQVISLDEEWATRRFLLGVRERKALSRAAELFLVHALVAG